MAEGKAKIYFISVPVAYSVNVPINIGVNWANFGGTDTIYLEILQNNSRIDYVEYLIAANDARNGGFIKTYSSNIGDVLLTFIAGHYENGVKIDDDIQNRTIKAATGEIKILETRAAKTDNLYFNLSVKVQNTMSTGIFVFLCSTFNVFINWISIIF